MNDERYQTPVFLSNIIDDSHLVKPLPRSTGQYPFRLHVEETSQLAVSKIRDRMAFHMVGDTGSVRHSAFQRLVASTLTMQHRQTSNTNPPAFLYHLGDIVYNHGEAEAYPSQFLGPYEDYPAPIFAIPGNHDGDINPDSIFPYQSLEAFVDVFCDTYPRRIGFGRGSRRLSMIQPHVHWTLETPLARFIGLYSNVPKHGWIGQEQRDWFIDELRHADKTRGRQALFVCIHHAPYSADTNHGSSPAMIDFLESAFLIAGVRPDAVFSGHVHNYQRFTKIYGDGTAVPFIVAGAGGYADLHRVATIDDPRVVPLDKHADSIHLNAFCDNAYGFLRVEVEKKPTGLMIIGSYYVLPRIVEGFLEVEPTLFDRFELPVVRPRTRESLAEEPC